MELLYGPRMLPMSSQDLPPDPDALRAQLADHARALGFSDIGISGVALDEDERHLQEWLAAGWHGDMQYMARHGSKRSRPAQLLPGTLRVISARMNYWPAQ